MRALAHRFALKRFVVAVMLASLVVPASSGEVLASSYTYPCHPPSQIYDYQEFVPRGAGLGGSGTDYYAVIGDANVRNTWTCTSPPEPVITAVLPVNLQVTNSNADIVQIGYAKCSAPTGVVCGDPYLPVPTDGNLHFVYICNDVSGGVPCNADRWAGAPVLGHRYRFEVTWSAGYWVYSIKDLTAGTGAKSATIPANWHYGDGAWWGGEGYDSNSMMGATAGDPTQIDMYWMQYLRVVNNGTWYVAWPDTIAKNTCPLGVGWPTWFGNRVYSKNYTNDAIDFWTSGH